VKPVNPLSFDALSQVVAPLVKYAVGLSGLGVLAMLGRQLLVGQKPDVGTPHEGPEKDKKEDGHDAR
ncbi:MAG: hypothetical protein Q8S17_13435, partial [Humidesulfovibrio sp.]|nr:hypothetical protein [Humidesulfovibrio sp.]